MGVKVLSVCSKSVSVFLSEHTLSACESLQRPLLELWLSGKRFQAAAVPGPGCQLSLPFRRGLPVSAALPALTLVASFLDFLCSILPRQVRVNFW